MDWTIPGVWVMGDLAISCNTMNLQPSVVAILEHDYTSNCQFCPSHIGRSRIGCMRQRLQVLFCAPWLAVCSPTSSLAAGMNNALDHGFDKRQRVQTVVD